MSRKPLVLAVDDDGEQLARIENELSTRYGRDYEIICQRSTVDAMHILRASAEAGQDVAIAMVDQSMPEITGVEFLAKTKAMHPTTRRALLVAWGAWGDDATAEMIVNAMTLGHIDYYVLKPWQTPDELFHKTVTAFLHDWLRSRAPEAPVARIVGDSVSRRSYELRNLLSRHRIDHVFLSVGSHEAQEVIGRLVSKHDVLPAVELFDGRVLVDPSNAELAAALGLKTRLPQNKGFDVVVIGGGPAGLSAAVYGASEGLRTLVVERQAIGGQAGTSSLIRNYVGFARGVSGSELAQQAYQQAWVFGATFLMTREATGIRQNGNGFIVELGHGEQALARTIVLTTGVSYRRLNVPNLEPLIGAGVFYGASLAEAQAMQGRDVFIVGGGNSAGQAATYLSTYASRVTIMVRSESLAESMSDYLIREIDAASNIDVRFRTEVVDGGGEGRLQYLVLADSESRREERVEADALFILIGAEPFTDWLPKEIERDRWGFILTGSDLAERRSSQSRDALDLETSVPGVFAAGDVRHGSVKRVASAVGEGSIAIRLVHEHLERQGIVRSQRAP